MQIEKFLQRATMTLFLAWLWFAILLAACNQAQAATPAKTEAQVAAPAQTEPPAVSAPVQDGKEGVRKLLNRYHGYALQYPASYDVAINTQDNVSLVRGSLLTVDQPRLGIQTQPADNQTLAQAVEQFVAGYAGFELKRADLTIDGEPAVVLDNVPGQDLTRVVLVVHGDRLYTLRFSPSNGSLGEVFSDMETLYNTVIYSFDFDPLP